MSVLSKPLYGQPCNDCGECCRGSRCPLGAALFGDGPDCPALLPEGCGLVIDPKRYAPSDVSERRLREGAMLMIGAGIGCDARLLGEPDDPGFKRRLYAWVANHRARARAGLRLWKRCFDAGRREATQ